jgi:hypothetical protein
MTQPTLHSTPPARAVLVEQIRAVALVLRLPAIAGAVLLGVATVLVIGERVTGGGPVDFATELALIPGLVAALLPVGVWKGEDLFDAAFLWTLPVDRRRHALAKVCAGWVWLMAAVAFFLLWFLGLAFFTGGNVLGDQMLRVLPPAGVLRAGPIDPAALQTVRWSPNAFLWVVPFTGATGAYLLASALALGTRHPLRWLVGIFFGSLLASAMGSASHIEWLTFGPARLWATLHAGPYGLDALLTARLQSLETLVPLSNGQVIGAWLGLPDLGHWAIATVLWMSVGLASLWAAASRHRERRRANEGAD